MQNDFLPDSEAEKLPTLLRVSIYTDKKDQAAHIAILYPDNVVTHWQKSMTRAELTDLGELICKSIRTSLATFHDRHNLMREAKANYEKDVN